MRENNILQILREGRYTVVLSGIGLMAENIILWNISGNRKMFPFVKNVLSRSALRCACSGR